jgi:hypothetical protein
LEELNQLIKSKVEVKGRSFHIPVEIIFKNNSSLHPVAYKYIFWLENTGIEELQYQRSNQFKINRRMYGK